MIIAGIDLGTASVKVVFINKQHELLWMKQGPANIDSIGTARMFLKEGLEWLKISDDILRGIAATGYGKRIFPDKDIIVDEITALSMGACVLSRGTAKTVVNIGGQDSKVVNIYDNGKVKDFKMNEKCAAGTGRFFEMASRVLNIPMNQFGDYQESDGAEIVINSTCAVFAESEIVSLLYRNIDKDKIFSGIYRSIARKTSDFIGNFNIDDEVYFDGGPALNKGLCNALKKELQREIKTFSNPQFTTAIGAAVILLNKTSENK